MRNENIEAQGSAIEYLIDYKDGKIKKGRGIECDLDNWMLYKSSQMCICLGHVNVGKTAWIMCIIFA